MAKVRKLYRDDPLAALPAWARKLAERDYTKTVSTFLLYGAVRDLQPISLEDGTAGFGTLKTFLSDELFGGRDHVIFYDRSSGIRASSPESQKDLSRAMAGYDALYGTDFAKSMPDRKSTRLNSSHANISYAVFCLKNKKYSSSD